MATTTTTTTTTANGNEKLPLSVSFSTLEIREFPLILGVNPSTPRGPPVEIDWHPQSCHVIDVDTFESERSARRTEAQLILSVAARVQL